MNNTCALPVDCMTTSACKKSAPARRRTTALLPMLALLALACAGCNGSTASSSAPTASWERIGEIPHIRYEGMTARVGDRVFLLGGFNDDSLNAFTRVDVFNTQSREWSRAADMPSPATHAQAAVVGDSTIWYAGGYVGTHPGPTTTDVWRYDVRTDRWDAGPSLPESRGGGSLVARGDTLHFVGGWLADRRTDAPEHWALIPGARGWMSRAPIPVPRGHHSAVAVDGSIYVIGGQINHDVLPVDLQDVHRYDAEGDTWFPVATLPATRSHAEPGTVLWRNWVFVPGGGDIGAGLINTREWMGYDFENDRWRRLPDLPTTLRAPNAWIVRDTMYLTGGGEYGHQPSNTQLWSLSLRDQWHPMPSRLSPLPKNSSAAMAVLDDGLFVIATRAPHPLRYDLGSGQWTESSELPQRPRAGIGRSLVAMGSDLWILGGTQGIVPESPVQIFSAPKRAWTLGPDLPTRVLYGAAAVASNSVWMIGGQSDDAVLPEVWRLPFGSTTWTPAAAMPRPRSRAVVAQHEQLVFVLGGTASADAAAAPTTDLQILDTQTGAWRVSSASGPQPLPEAVHGTDAAAALFVENELWLVIAAKTDIRVHIYNPTQDSWRAGPPLLNGGNFHAAAADGDRALILTDRALYMVWPTPR